MHTPTSKRCRCAHRQRHDRYEAYDFIYRSDFQSSPRRDGFRFLCQTDQREAKSYGWEWGYTPSHQGIFTAADIERYAASAKAIMRGLDKLARTDGRTDSAGRFLVRLTSILKLDAITLLEISIDGRFMSDAPVTRLIKPQDYGAAIESIDFLVTQLHRLCAKRVGKIAAA